MEKYNFASVLFSIVNLRAALKCYWESNTNKTSELKGEKC